MVVLALAIGIGGITAIFSIVYGVLLRPLPYGEPDGLVRVSVRNMSLRVSARVLEEDDWPRQQRVFQEILRYTTVPLALTGTDEAEAHFVPAVPFNFTDVLRVRPWMGRGFTADDAVDPPSVVLVSYGFWRERFGADLSAIGSELQTDLGALTVIGVMPPGFSFETLGSGPADLWLPAEPEGGFTIARLNEGISVEAAAAELTGIVERLEAEYPGSPDREVEVLSLMDAAIGADRERVLMLFLGAVAFVLVIAVANVANLMLARGIGREHEIAIRSAVGATRGHLVRQLLVESLFLSVLGGTLGVLVAYAVLGFIVAGLPGDFPRVEEIGIDANVLGLTLIVVVLSGFVFGILPALNFSAPQPDRMLKEGGRATTDTPWRSRFRSCLIAGEVALAAILLTGALLLATSFIELMDTPLGMDIENVIAATPALPGSRYDSARRIEFLNDLSERLRIWPDVEAVSVASMRGMAVAQRVNLFVDGESQLGSREELVPMLAADPEIFRVLGISITAGRRFQPGETAAVVTESFVRRFYPDRNPLDQVIDTPAPMTRIVGVVPDIRHAGLAEEPLPSLIASSDLFRTSVLVKALDNPSRVMDVIRAEVRAMDPEVIVSQTTLEQSLYDSAAVAEPRFRTAILGVFAAAALLLALVGISGVTSYAVARRVREVGIRMVLGGTRTGIIGIMFRQAMTPVLIGVALGMLGASNLTYLLSNYLYEVSPVDPTVFVATSFILFLTAAVAAWFPMRRSTSLDPMTALRYE